MKRIVFLALLAIAGRVAEGREAVALADSTKTDSIEGFRFTTVDSVAITSVKNQKNAGTCWSYSGMSFLESEALRTTGKVYDFSEMFVVENTYIDRAEKSVRTHGDVSFEQGGSFADVIYCLSNYGLVPDAEMPAGAMYGDTLSNHKELSAMTNPLVKAAASAKTLQFSPDGEALWKKAVRAVHEVYLGKIPASFTYEGKQYTPQSFAASTGLSADDYMSLTSFTHHPYSTGSNIGRGFIIEVQDNWRWAESINLELDDLMRIIDEAIRGGYSVLWGGDVSEDGFTRDGLAVWPDFTAADAPGTDEAKWLKLDARARGKELSKRPTTQKQVTAADRQRGYDNFETGDDHGMHLFGIATDQDGHRYYMLKNSWGKAGKYDGVWYMSVEYCAAKVLNYVVNKNAIPKDLRKKYGIQ